MAQQDDSAFLTTQEVAKHLGVSPSTVREWIKGGWVDAEIILSARPLPQRRVHRYQIARSTLTLFEQDTRAMFSDLQKYLPREKARQRRKVEKNQYQPLLPYMDEIS